MRGYAGRFLEVDLSDGNITETRFTNRVLRNFIGGRGLATKLLWDRLGAQWEEVDPFGAENLLLVFTGPMTGYFPGTKVCVSGKSPQSNGVIGSTVAGEFGVDLKCAGFDGVIVHGKAEKPCYLFICDRYAEIKPASDIWGKEARETVRFLIKQTLEDIKGIRPKYGAAKDPSILYIGPAGENCTRVAAVVSKYAHGAGYGGYGGVMGSKNLKAIAAKGFGPLPEIHDGEKAKHLYDEFSVENFRLDRFRRWGTGSAGYIVGAETSSEPIRNWQEEWHEEDSFKGEEFDKHWVKKYWGDFGCPTTCLKLAVLKNGKLKGAICDNPDYELEAYLGTNLGIFTPEENIYLSYISNELGLCGIQGGAVLGFAAELFQRGLLTADDLDGLEPEWGNAEAFEHLARKVAWREGIGDILAEGVYRAALKLGRLKDKDLLKYAVHEKGVAVGAHGVRSGKDYLSNISYACSVQAGDHTSVAFLPLDHGTSELRTIFHDSGVYCSFTTWRLKGTKLFEFYEATTGWKLTKRNWYTKKALRILHMQRAMLLLGGPDHRWNPAEDDDNPRRFWDPLPTGPHKGKQPDRKLFEESKLEYYQAVGWDEEGYPTPEALRKLGLVDVERKLQHEGLYADS